MAVVNTAIAKVVAIASNAFKKKARLRHALFLYRSELNTLIEQIKQSRELDQVQGTTILRLIIFLGAVYLHKQGKSEMAEAALKGTKALVDHLKQR